MDYKTGWAELPDNIFRRIFTIVLKTCRAIKKATKNLVAAGRGERI